MRSFQIHRRRAVMIKRAFPARDAHTPLIPRFQSGKTPLRVRRDQVVSVQDGEVQKFLCNLHTDRVLAHVFWSCSAIAVAIKPRQRIATTTLQFGTQNIRRHKRAIRVRTLNIQRADIKASSRTRAPSTKPRKTTLTLLVSCTKCFRITMRPRIAFRLPYVEHSQIQEEQCQSAQNMCTPI